MGLLKSDSLPANLNAAECYTKIYSWYKDKLRTLEVSESDTYMNDSRKFIENMKPPAKATDEDILEVFNHVVSNLLEWGYRCFSR